MDIKRLNHQHGLDSELVFSHHPSGLVQGTVRTSHCTGEFFLQGAHVTQYRDLLFMSQEAIYAQGKPLRGGIPICFPWFNSHPSDKSLPAHGWARTSHWEVLRTQRSDTGIEIDLGLSKDGIDLVYRIRMGQVLVVALDVRNASPAAIEYEVALHTYFRIGSIDQVAIVDGLQHCGYYDQLTQLDHPPSQSAIRFTEETDRIYYGKAPSIRIDDRSIGRTIQVESQGSESTVVWNPWIDKAKRMADFGDLEYKQMCCIETANVRRRSIRLEPGQIHATSVCIS